MSFTQAEFYFQIFPFAFFHAVIMNFGNTRALFQANLQPYFAVLDTGGQDFDIREQSVFPKTLDRSRYLIARNRYLIPDRQTGEADQHEVVVVSCARHLNTGNRITFRGE